jgi:aryl-alcohol dehydrogenase-like predicted oxidoreductase
MSENRGPSRLVFGRLGFGCYRVDDTTPDHCRALEAAIEAGCTLIDTSTNYTDGASERLVGSVLADLARRDPARRARLVVVSKIGYVQGRNLTLALEREKEGRPFPDMVRYMDGCWHCIHPEFLRDQLTRSRDRLQVETLDVCLLHNPEYFLSDAAHHPDTAHRGAGPLEKTRAEFDRRLREAFAFLEERVRAGEIRAYGVSSNTCVSPAGSPEATSVSRMLAAAEAGAGPGHNFRVLQLPMNLFETGAALERNTGPDSGMTALDAAASAGLAVLVNRPLNAFTDGRLVRLAEPMEPEPGRGLESIAADLEALEREHGASFGRMLGDAGDDAAARLFGVARQVLDLADQADDPVHWEQVVAQQVLPRVHAFATSLARAVPDSHQEEWRGWWERWAGLCEELVAEVTRRAAAKGRGATRAITELLDPALPVARRHEPLSRKAIWVLASTPGVSAVLLGMRRPEYVADAMPVTGWDPLPDPLAALRRFRHRGDA